jgi:hypothetical protein
MWPRNWRLQVARTIAVIGIAIGLVQLCHNESDTGMLRESSAQIQDAEQVRTAAAVAVENAKATAHLAEANAKAAVSRAARARARIAAIRVPVPVVEPMQLDSAAVASLVTLVRWKDTVIVRQDQRISADSLELLAKSHAFSALQRVKEPRCGRKCGVVLGVGGMLAAAVTIGQVRRAFR